MVCAARIIKNAGGTITAYDGDRIMGIFIGESKNTTAAKTALQINWAVSNIVNPDLKKQYGESAYQLKHAIGIDTSPIFVRPTKTVGSAGGMRFAGRRARTTRRRKPTTFTGTTCGSMPTPRLCRL